MNTIILLMVLITFFVLIGSGLFFGLTRPGKNLWVKWIYNSKYVVCHLRTKTTGFEQTILVVPAIDFITQVGTYFYNLNPRYATLTWKKRLHYILSEEDVVPIYPARTNDASEVIIQVREVKTALVNKAYDMIYKKQNNIAMLIAFAALVLSLLVIIYDIYQIQTMKSMLQTIVSQTQPQLSISP